MSYIVYNTITTAQPLKNFPSILDAFIYAATHYAKDGFIIRDSKTNKVPITFSPTSYNPHFKGGLKLPYIRKTHWLPLN